jgi:hypothetical protein
MCQLNRISWKTRKKLRIKERMGLVKKSIPLILKRKKISRRITQKVKRNIKYKDSSIEFSRPVMIIFVKTAKYWLNSI